MLQKRVSKSLAYALVTAILATLSFPVHAAPTPGDASANSFLHTLRIENRTEAGEEESKNVVHDATAMQYLNMMIFERDPDTAITATELERLQELSLSGMTEIQDWSWVQHCTGLETADLGNTTFNNASWIRSPKIRKLILAGTPLEHVEHLAELTQLEELNLSELGGEEHNDDAEHHHESSIDANIFSKMTNLKKLTIFECKVENAIKCSNLTKLEELDASHCAGFTPEAVQSMAQLKKLYLSGIEAQDISSLKNLNNLQALHLDNNQISDISPLKSLTSLTELNLKNNLFVQIEPLSQLTNMITLDISKNSETSTTHKIKDISALQNLTKLIDLRLDYNQIRDLKPISKIQTLKRLNLASNDLLNLEPLKNLSELTSLYISNNPTLIDISHLSSLNNIEELQCTNASVDKINALAPLYEGKMFTFNVADQKIERSHNEPLTKKSVLIPLVQGHAITYKIISGDEKKLKVIGDTLEIAPNYNLEKNPIVIHFADSFDKSSRFYNGTINVHYIDPRTPASDPSKPSVPQNTVTENSKKSIGQIVPTAENQILPQTNMQNPQAPTQIKKDSVPCTGESDVGTTGTLLILISATVLAITQSRRSKQTY